MNRYNLHSIDRKQQPTDEFYRAFYTLKPLMDKLREVVKTSKYDQYVRRDEDGLIDISIDDGVIGEAYLGVNYISPKKVSLICFKLSKLVTKSLEDLRKDFDILAERP